VRSASYAQADQCDARTRSMRAPHGTKQPPTTQRARGLSPRAFPREAAYL